MTCEICFSQVLEMNIIDKTKFATFSNSAFIMNYSFNMDSKLDRSVEGLLVERALNTQNMKPHTAGGT